MIASSLLIYFPNFSGFKCLNNSLKSLINSSLDDLLVVNLSAIKLIILSNASSLLANTILKSGSINLVDDSDSDLNNPIKKLDTSKSSNEIFFFSETLLLYFSNIGRTSSLSRVDPIYFNTPTNKDKSFNPL